MEEFQWLDLVSSREVRHRDILRAFRFLDPARLADMAQEEAAALLGESLSRVTLHGAEDGRGNLDHDPFSQYRSSRYRSPLSGKMTTTRPCEIAPLGAGPHRMPRRWRCRPRDPLPQRDAGRAVGRPPSR